MASTEAPPARKPRGRGGSRKIPESRIPSFAMGPIGARRAEFHHVHSRWRGYQGQNGLGRSRTSSDLG